MAERASQQRRAPLVGREAEIGRLQVCLDQALHGGEGALVLVSGEPGIGKTRLIEELAARAEDRGAVVVWGRVEEGEGEPPYWPWLQMLGTVLTDCDLDVVGPALEKHAGVIAAILPEVKELVSNVVPPPMLDPAEARFRLHQGIVAFLGGVSRRQRLVLVLEDLHWADVASLELTRFVAARVGAAAIVLVVSYRSVDAGNSDTFDDLLGSLARQHSLERVVLGGLSESEVGRFIAQSVDLEPGASAVTAVHARTEGNPFFVGELVRLLQSEGLLREGADREAARSKVPVGVRDVIRRRLARLPSHTRDLLELGAVIGRDFEVAVLATAAELSEVETLERLEAAVGAGLVGEHAASPGKFRFSHALIRDTLYVESNAALRATLHARVGQALERYAPPGTRLTEMAEHFFHAVPVTGAERALDYALAAAGAAQDALAYEQSEDYLRRAISLAGLLPAGPDRLTRQLQVHNRLVVLLIMTRGHGSPEVGQASRRARQLCQEIGETDDMLTALNNLAGFHYVHGDLSVVAEFGGQLLSVGLRRSNPRWLAAGHLFLGMAQIHTGRLVEARASFESLREVAADLEYSPEMAERFCGLHPLPMSLTYSAWTAWLLGEDALALDLVEEAVALVTRLGHPHTLALILYSATHLQKAIGNAPIVLAWSDRAIAFCDEQGLAAYQTWFRIFRGWAVSELGDPDEGVAQMASAFAIHQAGGARLNTSVQLALLAEGEARRGNHARALALTEEALAERGENQLWESELHCQRGLLLGALGPDRRLEATESLRQAVSLAEAQDAVPYRQRAQAALAMLLPADSPAVPTLSPAAAAGLSPRESELLGLVGRGLTDKQIAARLVISVATVHSHLDRIRDKTGRRRRAELTRLAVDLGLTGG